LFTSCIVASANVALVGQACVANDTTTYGSCSYELLCANLGTTDRCYAYCDALDVDACQDGESCVSITSDSGNSFGICVGGCSVWDQSVACGANEICIPNFFAVDRNGDDTITGKCIPRSMALKRERERCTFNDMSNTHDCDQGMICIDIDGDSLDECIRFCDLTHPERNCPDATYSDCNIGLSTAPDLGICIEP